MEKFENKEKEPSLKDWRLLPDDVVVELLLEEAKKNEHLTPQELADKYCAESNLWD